MTLAVGLVLDERPDEALALLDAAPPEATPDGGTKGESAPQQALAPEFGLVRDVELRLTVEVGSTKMAVGEVMQLEAGTVVELDRNVGDPADLLVNGTVIGRAEVTVEDDRLAIRVVELGPTKTRDS